MYVVKQNKLEDTSIDLPAWKTFQSHAIVTQFIIKESTWTSNLPDLCIGGKMLLFILTFGFRVFILMDTFLLYPCLVILRLKFESLINFQLSSLLFLPDI